ncbi:subtilisin-like serine peptidase serine peptidase clan SB family S8-like protein [Leptomonas seymouri]|uniref:Subtilisin-like serine peptidase serine peptidase clan SB family S8-like protein n=1 Tax=Leptomonas seymouri TaxID=5684 RepID=A0A0N1I991_LEPSE|nr:subtilisin-like serine peptidase serine peptidase clan SB family S8-like protein [Leptomonas seymouri]|eukprot:KPI89688.1 subtilisin-like serine peptidase serine peptidase clan SB family S8-like protein [Leptomonas seymouri]
MRWARCASGRAPQLLYFACVLLLLLTALRCLSVVAVYAAQSSKAAIVGKAPFGRGGTHPRDYYLGPFNASCVRPPFNDSLNLSLDEFCSSACFSGDGVQVALLDTGLCARVTEWSRNDVTCTSLVPGVACADEGCGHGTRSFSVLAGHLLHPTPRASSPRHKYIGMAPRASARVFRVFDREGKMQGRYVTDALDLLLREAEAYGPAHRAQGTSEKGAALKRVRPPVDIISLSYGGEDYYGNAAVQERLHQLVHSYGVLVVAAAGNDRYRFGSLRSPADMPGVLAVGAMELTKRATSAAGLQRRLNETSQASIIAEKSVAGFSGRGPTTWELPFGAGRVKPDLVALGQHVWAVEGVLVAPSKVSSNSSISRLQLRSISGTSIAAPIVAGAAAVTLEAVRWEAEGLRKASPAAPSHDRSRAYWMHRLRASLRVRQLLLSTAEPLSPAHELPGASPSFRREDGVLSSHRHALRPQLYPPHAGRTNATPRTELAGLPLTRLYARYLGLTKWSVMSQGMGEVQVCRALQRILSSTAAARTQEASLCEAFSIPAALRVGGAWPQKLGADAQTTGPIAQKEDSSLYWWPYSDMPIYPGATPLLFNLSLHLCPSWTATCRSAGKPTGEESQRLPQIHDGSSRDDLHGGHGIHFELTRVTGHQPRSLAHPHLREARAVVVLFSSGSSVGATRSRATKRLLERHLVRLASELREAAPPSPLSRRALLPLPATSFTLSTALSIPPTAHTRLRYCPRGLNVVDSVRNAANTRVSNEHIGKTGNSSRDDRLVTEDVTDACVPLFHILSDVTVEGELRLHDHNSRRCSDAPVPSSQRCSPSLLAIPVTIRIHAPPPRSQRVLIDTSLDWLNPTAASSDLFIAGDDPHETLLHADGDGQRASSQRPYAAIGGSHPHTNLALLSVYLRHSLGLAVSVFPLLHVATSTSASDVPGGTSAPGDPHAAKHPHRDMIIKAANAAAAAALSDVGTVILVSPKRPVNRPMRDLLTAAVRSEPEVDGLRVVLITDWYSAEIASALRWAREANEDVEEGSQSTDSVAQTTIQPSHHVSSGGGSRMLRAWRGNSGHRSNDSTASAAAQRSFRGLRGSCHVPSWNRWLGDLASAVTPLEKQCSTDQQHGGVRGLRHVFDAPFRLSEDVVIDGAIVVAASPPPSLSTSTRDSRVDAFRSLGQLNAAGVLHWTPTSRPYDNASSSKPNTCWRSEAVVCNVMPEWSQMQQRLRKRRLADDRSSDSADGEFIAYEDTWEPTARSCAAEHNSGVAVGPAPPQRAAPPSLTHGVLGFWTLPPEQPRHVASVQRRAAAPGRVAILTDANCFSTQDHHLQSALDELAQLTRTQDSVFTALPMHEAALHRWLNSAAAQKFVQSESVQCSSCVEVMKELLYWTQTGDANRWRDEAKLQCESRPWPQHALQRERQMRSSSNGDTRALEPQTSVSPLSGSFGNAKTGNTHSRALMEGRANRTAYRDDESGEEDDGDDLLHTAPARASVGAGVTRLWVSTVLAGRSHADVSKAGKETCGTPSLLRDTGCTTESGVDHNGPLSTVCEEASTVSLVLAGLFAAEQDAAEQEALRALSARYYGDVGTNTRASEGESTSSARREVMETPRGSPSKQLSSAASGLPLSYPDEGGYGELWQLLGWLRHPIITAQAVTCIVFAAAYCVYERWMQYSESGIT